MIVGLTGRVASGKSYYAKIFSEIFECQYIHCDELIKDLQIWKSWYNLSKEEYLKSFFGDDNFRNKVNKDCGRYIYRNFLSIYHFDFNILLESANLFSSELYKQCNKIILVESEYEIRYNRMLERGYSLEFIENIEKIQNEEFNNLSNITLIINN